jgi:type II secretory pathway predicted ATPase ExeA
VLGGSKKYCLLTDAAYDRLVLAMREEPELDAGNISEIARFTGLDNDSVSKIIDRKSVSHSSLKKMMEGFGLELTEDSYTKQSPPQKILLTDRPLPPNPFGKPIDRLEHLWTSQRQEEYRQLREAIGKGGSQAIVGPAGCGKSSMVKLLGREIGESVMHLDMHLVRDEGSFFDRLCDALDLESVEMPSRAMLKIERQLKKQIEPQVLCLDEVHVLTDERFFPEATRNWLRGMADSKLRLVVTSQRELRELFPDSSIRSSPLADFFDGQTLRLKALTRDEVAEFVDRGLRGTEVKFSAAQVEELWAESGGSLTRLHRSAQKLYDEYPGG